MKVILLKGLGYDACFTWVSSEDVRRLGIFPEATIAIISSWPGPIDAANVRPNAPFRLFIQSAMPAIIRSSQTIAGIAQQVGRGRLSIPDGRVFDLWKNDPVSVGLPSGMMIGKVDLIDGRAIPESYWPNPEYSGFTPGFGQLGVASVPSEFVPMMKAILERQKTSSLPTA